MNAIWDTAPFLPGFDPSQVWPEEDHQALLEASRPDLCVALWGESGAAFSSAVWLLSRARPMIGGKVQGLDLSRLTPNARWRAWSYPDKGEGLPWFEHAELIPFARRVAGAKKGRVASFVTHGEGEPEASGIWRWVRVPSLSRYRHLEEAIPTAWRHLGGGPLPRSLVTALVSQAQEMDADALERLLVATAPRGREALSKRLDQVMLPGLEGSAWKRRKRLVEKALLDEALEKNGGNRTRAAKTLGVHRNTVLWHLRKWKQS